MYFILGPGVSLYGFGSVAHSRNNDIVSLLSAILIADPAAIAWGMLTSEVLLLFRAVFLSAGNGAHSPGHVRLVLH